jgi:phosphoribosylanthranilate isomerase
MKLASQRTRIKICGLSREADIDAAVEAGADAVGFVFYAPSARAIDIERAAALAAQLPAFVTPVGLFVNAAPAEVSAACTAIPALVPQVHGDETAEQCRAAGRPYLRAARMVAGFNLLDFASRFCDAQALLLDAHVEGYGGGGKAFDWSLVPQGVSRPLVLSGGLNPANVIDGVLRVRPWAVDVSSGVEHDKGVKDADAIRRFCDAVREADARIAGAAT